MVSGYLCLSNVHCAQFIVVMCITLHCCTQCTLHRVHDKVAARRQPGVRCEVCVVVLWSAAACAARAWPPPVSWDWFCPRLARQRGAGRSWAQPAAACCCRGRARAQHPPWSCSVVSRAGEQARAWHLALSREQTVILSSVRHTTNIIRLSNPTQLSRSVVFAICIVNHQDGQGDEQRAEHTSWHVTSDDSRQHQQWWQWWY